MHFLVITISMRLVQTEVEILLRDNLEMDLYLEKLGCVQRLD
jgi:hypothetical protein